MTFSYHITYDACETKHNLRLSVQKIVMRFTSAWKRTTLEIFYFKCCWYILLLTDIQQFEKTQYDQFDVNKTIEPGKFIGKTIITNGIRFAKRIPKPKPTLNPFIILQKLQCITRSVDFKSVCSDLSKQFY